MAYGAIALIAAILANNVLLPKMGLKLGMGGIFGFAACGVFFLIGLLEVVTNRPFVHWAHKWNSLKGWQRGVLGTFIAISALVSLVVSIGVYFTYFAD